MIPKGLFFGPKIVSMGFLVKSRPNGLMQILKYQPRPSIGNRKGMSLYVISYYILLWN
jgi:hypothetical protein